MEAKIICTTCGITSESGFNEACEEGCPVCGSNDIEIQVIK